MNLFFEYLANSFQMKEFKTLEEYTDFSHSMFLENNGNQILYLLSFLVGFTNLSANTICGIAVNLVHKNCACPLFCSRNASFWLDFDYMSIPALYFVSHLNPKSH